MIFPVTSCWILHWMDREGPEGPTGKCVMHYYRDEDDNPVVFWDREEALDCARELSPAYLVWIEELTGKRIPKEVTP